MSNINHCASERKKFTTKDKFSLFFVQQQDQKTRGERHKNKITTRQNPSLNILKITLLSFYVLSKYFLDCTFMNTCKFPVCLEKNCKFEDLLLKQSFILDLGLQ